ncbi:unnamed protein product [Prorocentrum cordatum]|uniref:Uncharacterized protein n=1 Tax=Prorocentrum cordatum TaxID=2364126 RepID=A0ABN9W6A8_9DINO|nr:unnamed protein product [Polarella glacialis]
MGLFSITITIHWRGEGILLPLVFFLLLLLILLLLPPPTYGGGGETNMPIMMARDLAASVVLSGVLQRLRTMRHLHRGAPRYDVPLWLRRTINGEEACCQIIAICLEHVLNVL